MCARVCVCVCVFKYIVLPLISFSPINDDGGKRLYGVRHMVKDHSDSERGILLSPHGLLFPINIKG